MIEQLPFKVPAGTTTLTEMAPVKSEERTLPITEEARPFFERQLATQARQKELSELSGKPYYDNDLVVAKPDGAPLRRERVSADFGQMLRRQELPHIRFHDRPVKIGLTQQSPYSKGGAGLVLFYFLEEKEGCLWQI